jgi:hypothetical protein
MARDPLILSSHHLKLSLQGVTSAHSYMCRGSWLTNSWFARQPDELHTCWDSSDQSSCLLPPTCPSPT